MASVMPKPCAAFSPLTMTKSSSRLRRSSGKWLSIAWRPDLPTTSPQIRIFIAVPYSSPAQSRNLDVPFISDHPVERLVALRARHPLHPLRRIGDADGYHRMHFPERRQRAVVEAAAPA